jgi:uncharacterized phage-associated protein
MRLDPQKLAQASAQLLRRAHGHQMGYMRLLKLLYIANRESLAETGRPIVADRVVAMDRGPVLSNVLNVIKGQDPRSAHWDKYVARDGYTIQLNEDPGFDELSRFEINKLEEVSNRFCNTDVWELVELTHTFPEWKKHYVPKTSTEIPMQDILEAVGLGSEAANIIAEQNYAASASDFFAKECG